MEPGTAPRCAVVWTSDYVASAAAEISSAATLSLPTPASDDDADWVPRTALAISAALTEALPADRIPALPLVLVFTGDHSALAPFIGFAQRAARRSVVAYVLIDPQLPPPGSVSDWPDAPVHVVVSRDDPDRARAVERAADLRGWPVHTSDPVDVVRDIVNNL